MTEVRQKPCSACPYRKDVPSGVWSAEDYEKLRQYDDETPYQPFKGFSCHATPNFYCAGWAQVHTSRGHEYDLISLRFNPPSRGIPAPVTELFSSGNEAADHGLRDLKSRSAEAVAAQAKLLRQHPRLRKDAQ